MYIRKYERKVTVYCKEKNMKKDNTLIEFNEITLVDNLTNICITKIMRYIGDKVGDDDDFAEICEIISKSRPIKSMGNVLQVIYNHVEHEYILAEALALRENIDEGIAYLDEKYDFYSTYFKNISNKFLNGCQMYEVFVFELFDETGLVKMDSFDDYITSADEEFEQLELIDQGLVLACLSFNRFDFEWLYNESLDKGRVSEFICGVLGVRGIAYSQDMSKIYCMFSIEEALELFCVEQYCIESMVNSFVSGICLLLEKRKVCK